MTSAGTEVTYNLADFPPGLVAIPAMEWIWTDCAAAFLKLTTTGLPPGAGFAYGRVSSSPAANRNALTETFLKLSKLQWILFIDSDMVPPPAIAVRLLSHNVAVVGATCRARTEPFNVCALQFADRLIPKDWDTIHEVDIVGSGCLLVRREVIEAMPYPWFEHPVPGLGEDGLFCRKARQLGYPIYVDCGVEAGHVRIQSVGSEEAHLFQDSARGREVVANFPSHEHFWSRALEEVLPTDPSMQRYDGNAVRAVT